MVAPVLPHPGRPRAQPGGQAHGGSGPPISDMGGQALPAPPRPHKQVLLGRSVHWVAPSLCPPLPPPWLLACGCRPEHTISSNLLPRPIYDRQGVQELTILFLHLGLFHLALSMLSEAPWTHLGPRTSSTRPRYPRQRCPITSHRKGSCSGRMDAKVFWRSQSPRERAPPPRSRSQQPAAHPADAARLSRLGALPWPRRRRLAGAGSRPPDPPDPQAPAKPAHDHCVMFAIVTSQWF